MKTKLTTAPVILFLSLLVFFSPLKLISQSVTISGASSVSVNAQETYIANFTYNPHHLSIISWSVTGGTITSQNIYPNNGTIYCDVQWNSTPCAGSISIYEDLNGGFAEMAVDIGNYSTYWNITGEINNTTTINCTPITNNTCNYIQNHNFLPTIPPYDENNWNPFVQGLVPFWVATHGTPHLFDGFDFTIQAPPPAVRFAYMWTKSPSAPGGTSTGEGVAQKIKPLTIGSTYNLSFYLRYSLYLLDPAASLDHFYVYLIHCYDYNNFPLSTFDIPTFPPGAQMIYDGTNINNPTWEQIQVNFTANDAYDMIWFVPKQGDAGAGHTAGLNFAYPVLSNSTNSITVTPAGPVNICTPWEYAPTNTSLLTSSASASGQYQWYKDNQIIPGATSQTLNAQHSQQGMNLRTHLYSVIDPIGGCSSSPVTVNFVATPLPPVEGVGNLLKGVWQTIRTTENLPLSTYTWNIPGASIIDVNNNDPWADVFFPTNSPNSVSGYVTITGAASCANSTYTYQFLLFQGRHSEQSIDKSDQLNDINSGNEKKLNSGKLFPNPAKSFVTISSKFNIENVDIFNLDGNLIRKIKANRSKSYTVNVEGLTQGIYIIKITTNIDINYMKLLIQR